MYLRTDVFCRQCWNPSLDTHSSHSAIAGSMLCHATAPRCHRVGEMYRWHRCPAQTALTTSCTAHSAHTRDTSRPVVSSALWLSLELVPLQLLIQGNALADESATYNVGAQSEFLQTLVGVLWLGLVAYFFYRVFTGRASRFISGVRALRFCVSSMSCWHRCCTDGCFAVQRVGASTDAKPVEEDPYLAEPVVVTPFKAFISAAQALAIAAVLWFLATTLDTAMSTAELPDQYTVRSIAVTLRTIVTGLAHLATFIFAANGVGLAALTLKLAIFGDDEVVTDAEIKPKIPDNIPNVGLTSHPEDVMRAFDEVSDPSRYRKDKTQA